MPKAASTFSPIGNSETRMHGSPAILASGYSAAEQQQLRQMLDSAGLTDIGLIYITAESLSMTLKALAEHPAETNAGQTAELPLAMILSGLTERELHAIMDQYRKSALPRPLWASATPTSENWTVKQLLIELLKEREAMRQAASASAENTTENGKAE